MTPVYLKLLHGRDDPAKDMEEYGFDGPVLGPFDYVHVTYNTMIDCGKNGEPIQTLRFHQDMIEHEGKFYGDWEVATSFGQKVERKIKTVRLPYKPAPTRWRERLMWLLLLGLLVSILCAI